MNGKLIVTEGGRDRVHEICDEITVIGTGQDADLHLKDPQAAPAHCEVRTTDRGFKIVDLETAEGTTVNGQVVNQHLLLNGDTIRIGEARITYLGASSSPPPRPKAPITPPLTSLPVDEDGNPKRFYRHESDKGTNTIIRMTLVVAGLSLVALLLVWLNKSSLSDPAVREDFQKARQLIQDKRGISQVKRAVTLLKSLPTGTIKQQRIDEALEDAKVVLFELEKAKQEEKAQAEAQRILSMLPLDATSINADQIPVIRHQIRLFANEFPDDLRLPQLQDRLTTYSMGGAAKVALFKSSEERLRKALAAKNFKAAFAEIDSLSADTLIATAKVDKLNSYRATLNRAFKEHFESMSAKAVEAHTSGNTPEAVRIYTELAAVGAEPWSSRAKLLLTKIQ